MVLGVLRLIQYSYIVGTTLYENPSLEAYYCDDNRVPGTLISNLYGMVYSLNLIQYNPFRKQAYFTLYSLYVRLLFVALQKLCCMNKYGWSGFSRVGGLFPWVVGGL